MNTPVRRQNLIGIIIYIVISLLILFFRLMPITPGLPGLPGPSLILCLTFAWVLRRPDQLPAVIIVISSLVGDFVLGRPFGLWSFLLLTGTEILRPRAMRWSDQPFLFEWLRVSLLIGLMIISYRLILIVFLLPVPAFGTVIIQWLVTAIAYPLTVLVVYLIGVRRLSAAEIEMMVH